jgi:citrate synthase
LSQTPVTSLCTHSLDSIHYREANIVDDLLGKRSFTEVMFMQIMGRAPRPMDLRVIDACMIALMEHGLTPSAISTRLVYMSAPENLQGAVAAGLLAVGSQFVGTMENCSRLLDLIEASGDIEAAAMKIALEHRGRKASVPGFGHHLHKPDDPRAAKLIALARAEPDFAPGKLDALAALSSAVDAAWRRHITINATGAAAALLGGIGVPTEIMRGFAVVSRAAGLVSHIAEEQKSPSGRFIWETIDHAIPFVGRNKETQ